MRILIAGATGAIGWPLVRRLRANQHEVFALTRSPDSAAALEKIGAEAVIADVLDTAAVKAAVGRIRPDDVINELTSLPRHYTPVAMNAAAGRDHKVRVEGNITLLATLRDAGVRRYVLQSSGFWYAPGKGLADESVPFISSASPGVEAGARTYLELEARASATPGIEFVALRYGFFYGPGTWYTREGDVGDCSGGDRCRAGVPAGTLQHRRWKPIASALVAGGVRALCRSTCTASYQRTRRASEVRRRRALLCDEAEGRFERESRAGACVPSASARMDLGLH